MRSPTIGSDRSPTISPTISPDLDAARARLDAVCPQVREAGPADTIDGVPVRLLARPSSTRECAEVMRAATASGLVVVARGRGTKLGWGFPPQRADLVVDTSAMDAVVDHAAGDLIVEVQAGAHLAAVQDVVAGAGQRLAVDTTVPGASVGGTLATAASGPLRLSAGTVRDLLIGVTLVRADGVVAHAGGRVVKNVAGYDLGKLLVGSFGTLGIITQAVFRLHPLPQAAATLSVPVADPADAARVTAAVLHSQVVPAAVEVEWPADGAGAVHVLVEGTTGGVRARAARLALLCGADAHVSDALPPGWARYPWHDGDAVDGDLVDGDAVEGGSSGAAGGSLQRTALKLTFAVSGLADVLGVARSAGAWLRGSAGAGVVYGALPAGSPPAEVMAALARLRAVCAAHGGAVTVVDAPAGVKAAVDVWGPVAGLDLMRAVKDRFDPDRRLAPGRFVGGL